MAYSEEYKAQLEARQGSGEGNYGLNGTTTSASDGGNYNVGISGPVAGEATTPTPQGFTPSPLLIIAITVVVTLVIVAAILLLTKKFRIVRAR